MNIESNTTITDVANWLFAQFQTGIRPLNIFQASNIVVFDETGNFNIICTKFVDGDQLTGIAVNHWTGNTFSFAIDYDKVTWHWKRLVTNSDLQSESLITKSVDETPLTANIEYRIKSGVCYVTVYWIAITSTSDEVILDNNMPTPMLHCYAPIIDHITGDNLGLIIIDTGQSRLFCRARKTGVGFSTFSYPIA